MVNPMRLHARARRSNIALVAGALLFVAVLAASCSGSGGKKPAGVEPDFASTSMTIPPEYQELYNAYDAGLNKLDSYLSGQLQGRNHPVTFAAELLAANGNRGAELLEPGEFAGAIKYLNRLDELGVGGVTVAIGYPLFTPSFPRYQEYVSFYRRIAGEVRKRGMKLDVEALVLFANTPFSPIKWDFTGLTLERYKAEALQMDQAIIKEVAPDYLDIGAEPDTAARLLGMPELGTPTVFADYARYISSGLVKGSTLVGAGGSTWGPLTFDQELVGIPSIDFIAIHIYPLSTEFITNALQAADLARAHGKRVILDEAWLYKSAPGDSTSDIAGNTTVFGRDVFSFWAPLDREFLKSMAELANLKQVDYVSAFWANYFFSYILYDDRTKDLPYRALIEVANRAAAMNIDAGVFSPTGEYYRDLIHENIQ